MKKNYFFYLFVFQLSFCTIQGQEYYLYISDSESVVLWSQVQLSKASDTSTQSFVKKAKSLKIGEDKIDSLLYAKEKFLYLDERIKEIKNEKDASFLFVDNKVHLHRNQNLNAYKKSVASILNKDRYYELFKEIIDSRTALSTAQYINEMSHKYALDKDAEGKLQALITPFEKEACTLSEYFGYDESLAMLKYLEQKKLYEPHVKEFIQKLGIVPKNFLLSKLDPQTYSFIQKAESVGLSDEKIELLSERILSTKEKLQKSEQENGIKEKFSSNLLGYRHYGRMQIIDDFEIFLTSELTIAEYRALFSEDLRPKAQLLAIERLNEIEKRYNLTALDADQNEVLKTWISKFALDEIVAHRYHAYAKALAVAKVKEIQYEADKKYKSLILEFTKKKPMVLAPSLRERNFLVNARKQNVDMQKAKKILHACLSYELKQEGLMAAKKYDKSNVYQLETDYNDKIKLRNEFRYYLSKNLTQDEFKKLFWNQLEPDIDHKVQARLKKIQVRSRLEDDEYAKMKELMEHQITKEVVAQHYYSYDKKLSSQKVKALQYKFDNEYQEIAKQFD